jgi:taurine dioxygenase
MAMSLRAVSNEIESPITVRKLALALGAEIGGVDLGAPMSDATFEAIHAALMENQVIFFRDQQMTMEQQLALATRFGPPTYSKKLPKYEGHDYTSLIQTDGSTINVGGKWHSDNTDFTTPPMGAVLYAETVPSFGGDTLFASMYAAYDALSAGMRTYLDGLYALHDNSDVVRRFAGTAYLNKEAAEVPPPAKHPVVRVHPVTGRKALYVNSSYTRSIVGVPDTESKHILAMLLEHVQLPEFQVRFQWRPGSVTIWDNRCTQHYAPNDYREPRRMRRVQIDGDVPRGPQPA